MNLRPDAEPPSSGLLLGRIAMRHSELVPRTLNEAIGLQDRLRAIGGTAPPLGQILLDLSMLDGEMIENMLAWQRDGAPPPDDRIGALAVLNGFSTGERVRRAAERQAAAGERGDPPQRLGELLVASGDLTSQAARALLAAQARLRGSEIPELESDEPWEVVPGGYRLSGDVLLLEAAPELVMEERIPPLLVAALVASILALAAALAWALTR